MEGSTCFVCERPYLLQKGKCVPKCTETGYRPNNARTKCINKTEFPAIGPIWSVLASIVIVAILIIKTQLKKETEVIPSLIASVSIIEYLAILFQIWMCIIFAAPKYLIFTIIAFCVLMCLNVFNMYYIKTYVASKDARKEERLK